jgi:hypothetical protein
MTQAALLTWINSHDTGVWPAAVLTPQNTAVIRSTGYNSATDEHFRYEDEVSSYADARRVLGY